MSTPSFDSTESVTDLRANSVLDLQSQSQADQAGSSDDTVPVPDGEKLDKHIVVEWEGPNDPSNPYNFSPWRKWSSTVICSVGALCVACSSSIYTATYEGIQSDLHVKQITAITGLTLFVFGMGAGPMLYAPLSEFYGRRIIYIVAFVFYLAFQFPVGFGRNITSVLVNRLLSGLAGSAFLSVAGGTVSDLFEKHELGKPMMIFTAAPFLGPSIGPLLGDFIVANLSWRWVFYVMMIWTAVMLILILAFVPETYSPVLLRWKAQKLRKRTGNMDYMAPIEHLDRSVLATVAVSCKRPFQLLFFDIMVFSLCLYTAILLGINYLLFQAFTLVFVNNKGFSHEHVGLSFMGLLTGIIIGVLSEPYWKKTYSRLAQKHGAEIPEYRLPQAMMGSIFVPIGMLWFAFTTYKSVHYIVPIIACLPFGFGLILVYSGVFTYLVEAYRPYSASALAANGFLRSSFAAIFPLFSVQMYDDLGYAWASALLAFLCLACTPFPFLFYKFGERLRSRSRFAWSVPPPQQPPLNHLKV
ncbi:major facilitator superfamily domain-containing protein [Lipomyces arxii]|uniref:major facilitator superfamily domain-containing protein n=1 Tax=Lipomyces arxii TaxID=56418 RepID=UPI0034CEE99B